jgi:anhydro-N-acetylmuramic acid kinase
MTGTSMDAVDAALIRIDGAGLEMRATVLACATEPMGSTREILQAAAQGKAVTVRNLASAVHALSEQHGEMARCLIKEHGCVDLVAMHGQTIVHSPPISVQAIDPAVVARAAQAPVVSDLRGADLAAGGEGAPITPIADWILFRSEKSSRAIVNLGGFCNVTMLAANGGVETVTGGDVCACNQILDAIARQSLNAPFDMDGRAALLGEPNSEAVAELVSILIGQRSEPRSLGSGDESADWVANWLSRLAPSDLACSAATAIGLVIAEAVSSADKVYLAGGGCQNQALFKAIADHSSRPILLTNELGVLAPFREAVAMAILGCLCADGVPITLPSVTGVSSPAPVAGSWTNLPNPPMSI